MGRETAKSVLESHFTMDWPMGIPYESIYTAMQEYANLQQSTNLAKIKELEAEIKDSEKIANEIEKLYESEKRLLKNYEQRCEQLQQELNNSRQI